MKPAAADGPPGRSRDRVLAVHRAAQAEAEHREHDVQRERGEHAAADGGGVVQAAKDVGMHGPCGGDNSGSRSRRLVRCGLRALAIVHSLKRSKPTNRPGIRMIPIIVAASMPPNTVTPMSRRLAAPAPVADDQRHDAKDEGEGSHQHGAEAQARPRHGRFRSAHAGLALLLGELDDQNRILRRQADQQHHADLRVDVVVECRRSTSANSAPTPATLTESEHRERDHPALILRHQEEIRRTASASANT